MRDGRARDGRKKDDPRARLLAEDDRIWLALADGSRRQMLDRLREGPRSTAQLCAEFPWLARTAVMKHLERLVEAGLVLVRREGRRRINVLHPVPLVEIVDRWVSPYAKDRVERFRRLAEHIESQRASATEDGAGEQREARQGEGVDA
ncbi:MAG: winged helix-turn-helix transcriptional regulator [Planctomycetes bacterium]|nr:winged helix-turn-helix transcriptional regulator [Planctomycetota bacterium]